MLPLIYMMKEGGSVAEYDHWLSYCAVHDFIDEMPGKKREYYSCLKEFTSKLYSSHCQNGETYFLDKTPRYYLIIKELSEIFPEAKFIFLVRNPLQILGSLVSTFSNNTLRNLHFYHIDIFKGFDKIAEGMDNLKERSIVVRYEDIIQNSQGVLSSVFDFLALNWSVYDREELDDRGLTGRLGDKVGTYEYKQVQDTGIEKWKEIFQERTRRNYLYKVISRLDDHTLNSYGYPKGKLLELIDEIDVKTTIDSLKDMSDLTTSWLVKKFYLNLFRPKIKSWSKEVTLS